MDQFYTLDNVAKECYETFIKYVLDYDYIVEPSAGKGSFFKLLDINKRIGYDIDPKYDGIKLGNYFDFKHIQGKTYAVIGNPPFGKISSLAVKFFNKSAEYASIIAFILPRTFKRVSIQNKLDMNFHLVYNKDLPMGCFSPKMSAKCSFQIWIKKDVKREPVIYDTSHPDFNFIKMGPKDLNNQPTPPVMNSDFAIKAYGSGCGEVVDTNLEKLRPKSWHWIKSNIDLNVLKERLNNLDYSMSKDTVRQDSIGQKELIFLYKSKFFIHYI